VEQQDGQAHSTSPVTYVSGRRRQRMRSRTPARKLLNEFNKFYMKEPIGKSLMMLYLMGETLVQLHKEEIKQLKIQWEWFPQKAQDLLRELNKDLGG
jgi:hypothetical protein